MPLNASERVAVAKAMLENFGENAQACGQTLAYMSQFTVGTVNLLVETQNQATTWPAFLASGLSIEWWKTELARYYNATIAAIS